MQPLFGIKNSDASYVIAEPDALNKHFDLGAFAVALPPNPARVEHLFAVQAGIIDILEILVID